MSSQNGLTSRQKKAIALLMSGKSKTSTANEIGINLKTVERWFSQETFSQALRKESEIAIRYAAVRMASMLELAASVYHQAMTKPEKTKHLQLSAARATVADVVKLVELDDIIARIEQLEARYESTQK